MGSGVRTVSGKYYNRQSESSAIPRRRYFLRIVMYIVLCLASLFISAEATPIPTCTEEGGLAYKPNGDDDLDGVDDDLRWGGDYSPSNIFYFCNRTLVDGTFTREEWTCPNASYYYTGYGCLLPNGYKELKDKGIDALPV